MALVTINGTAWDNSGNASGAQVQTGRIIFDPVSLDEATDIVDSARRVYADVKADGSLVKNTGGPVKLWPGIWRVTLPDLIVFEVGIVSGQTYTLLQLRNMGMPPGTFPPFTVATSLIIPGSIPNGQLLSKSGTTVTGVPQTTFAKPEEVILKTFVDAKGDLLTATANDAPARLPAGANGQILISDPSQPTGLKWGNDSYLPAYMTAVASPSSQVVIKNSWTVVAFPTPTVNVGGTWNASTNTWTVPYTGRYFIIASIRAIDNATVRQVGIGVSTINGDGPGVMWRNYPLGIRDVYAVTREDNFAQGAQLRLSMYTESADLTLQGATLAIRRVS